MHDLEHDDETVVISSLLKWLPAEVLYHMRHAARCAHTLEVVDSAKYLGVTISEDLQWSKHIDNTVSKANRTMGFIRRNLRDCTKPTVDNF
jgi:hypothetical protein